MKKIISLTGCLLFFLSFFLASFSLKSCSAEKSCIKDIDSFKQVDLNILSLLTNKFVIFDVDHTLITTDDACLYDRSKFYKKIKDRYKAEINKQKWEKLFSILFLQAKARLIDKNIINSINELKKNNIPVIACTSMQTGPYGILRSREEWRYEELKSLGFEGSFEDVLEEFPFSSESQDIHRTAVFYKGVLAADRVPKGMVVGEFLDYMELTPDEIIMFDDSRECLKSVQQECAKRKIAFTGYDCKGMTNVPNKSWDEDLFEFQAKFLIQYEKWLDDKTAAYWLPAIEQLDDEAAAHWLEAIKWIESLNEQKIEPSEV